MIRVFNLHITVVGILKGIHEKRSAQHIDFHFEQKSF